MCCRYHCYFHDIYVIVIDHLSVQYDAYTCSLRPEGECCICVVSHIKVSITFI